VQDPPSIDQLLAQRCAAGDRRAFSDAVTRHLPSLFVLARSSCGGELAATEVVLRAVEAAREQFRTSSTGSNATSARRAIPWSAPRSRRR